MIILEIRDDADLMQWMLLIVSEHLEHDRLSLDILHKRLGHWDRYLKQQRHYLITLKQNISKKNIRFFFSHTTSLFLINQYFPTPLTPLFNYKTNRAVIEVWSINELRADLVRPRYFKK